MDRSQQKRDHFFPWERFRFSIRATGLMVLPPYKGGVLRGAFGAALRDALCALLKKDCTDCSLAARCGYARIFEPTPPPDFPDAGRFSSAPPPYVLIPPLDARQAIHPDEHLDFEVTLMGGALELFPYVLFAFEQLGKRGLGRERGRYVIERVDMIRGDHATMVYDGETGMISGMISPPDVDFPEEREDVGVVDLHLITPLRLKEKGKLATALAFPLFFERLAQRLTLLSRFYGKNGQAPEFGPLLENARDIETESRDLFWYDWSRYSGRQKAVMKFGGLRGKVRFKGRLSPFLPWLRLGEQVNVGQNTTFGLGKYEMEYS